VKRSPPNVNAGCGIAPRPGVRRALLRPAVAIEAGGGRPWRPWVSRSAGRSWRV